MKTLLLKKKYVLLFIVFIFCASISNVQGQSNNSNEPIQSFTLEFTNVNGPAVNRILDLSFSPNTSENYDEGFDTKNASLMQDDLNLFLNGEYFTSQAYSSITEDKIIDPVFQASGSYDYSIELVGIENMGNQNVELRDNLLDTTFNLRSDDAYIFPSDSGYFPGRFQLTFKTTLSNLDLDNNALDIKYVNNSKSIVVNNPYNQLLKKIEVFAVTGQTVFVSNALNDKDIMRYDLSNLCSGIYIIKVEGENNNLIVKKIIIN